MGIDAQTLTRNATANARPMSWHPSFISDFQQYPVADQQLIHEPYECPINTTFAYGLVTPTTCPTISEPYINCPDLSLNPLAGPNYDFVQKEFFPSGMHQYAWDNNSTAYTPMSTGHIDGNDYGNYPWPSVPLSNTYDIATAPASPDFLPMPDMGHAFEVSLTENDIDTHELVGMGLYDSPAQVQSASLLFGGSMAIRKKSLKLEESFEPPSPEDGECEDEDEDGDGETDHTQLEDDSTSHAILEQPIDLHGVQQPNTTFGFHNNNDISYSALESNIAGVYDYGAAYRGQQLMNNGMMYSWF